MTRDLQVYSDMRLYMYVCVHLAPTHNARTYTHTYIHVDLDMHEVMYVCADLSLIYTYTHAYVHAYVHIRRQNTYTCIYIAYIHTCARLNVWIHSLLNMQVSSNSSKPIFAPNHGRVHRFLSVLEAECCVRWSAWYICLCLCMYVCMYVVLFVCLFVVCMYSCMYVCI